MFRVNGFECLTPCSHGRISSDFSINVQSLWLLLPEIFFWKHLGGLGRKKKLYVSGYRARQFHSNPCASIIFYFPASISKQTISHTWALRGVICKHYALKSSWEFPSAYQTWWNNAIHAALWQTVLKHASWNNFSITSQSNWLLRLKLAICGVLALWKSPYWN
jgi:hypothetical protein